MAINFTTKYLSQLEQVYTHDSYLKPHCKAHVDLIGAKTCRVYMLNTVPLANYQRSGLSRYGTPADIQDTVVEYTMTQDMAFTGIVDKGDASEQAISNKAGQWMRQQNRERIVPAVDSYGFSRMAKLGHLAGQTAAPAKDDVISRIYAAGAYMDEHLVPENGRVVWIKASDYPKIIMSEEWSGLDSLAGKQLPTGTCGQVAGFTVIRTPSKFFPDDVYMIAAQESALALPYRINDTKVHEDPPGISGTLMEGRIAFDLFVIASKADSVYCEVSRAKQLPAPVITISSGSASVTCSGASEIYVTSDGSDPRFSADWNESRKSGRKLYSGAFAIPSGCTVRAAGFAEDKFTSPVAEKANPV